MNIFRDMSDSELGDVICSILAMRHLFDTEAGSWSGRGSHQAPLLWAEGHQDRLEDELRAACIEYAKREMADEDEQQSRQLTLASALSWIPDNPFEIEVSVKLKGGAA